MIGRTTLVLGLLALSLAAPVVRAQTAVAGTAAPVANAVDPAAIQALKDMGAHLQTLRRFQATTSLTGERVLADGQKLQHSATAELDVDRPNRLRARMVSARSERELIYDGKTVTLFTPAQKYYSRSSSPTRWPAWSSGCRSGSGWRCRCRTCSSGARRPAPIEQIQSAMNAGQDFVGDDLCDHYAFRQGALDWQVWITTGSKPLPRRSSSPTGRRGAAAVGLADHLEPEAGVQGHGVQLQPAEGQHGGRTGPAEDEVGERRHDTSNQQTAAGPARRCGGGRTGAGAGGRRCDKRGGGGARAGGGGGGEARAGGGAKQRPQANNSKQDARTNNVRNTSVNNVNNSVNVNKNVNVNVDSRGGCCGWDNDYHRSPRPRR